MSFIPFDLMLRRVDLNGSDSDTIKFNELLYFGELILKFSTAAFLAAVENNVDGHQYRLTHGLVRADGIGEWASRLDEILSGPPSQYLCSEFSEDRRIFNERVGTEGWQYEAVSMLHEVLIGVEPSTPPLPGKVTLRSWFTKFSEVRNKTRSHGAITPATCIKLLPCLESAVKIIIEKSPIFARPWVYLHRNLSGKYRVISLTGSGNQFDKLKTASSAFNEHFGDGIYLWAGQPRLVDLIRSDINASDFFVPNGDFNGRSFELLSLITGGKSRADATPYLAVAGDRPPSETDGQSELEVVGEVFTNLPDIPTGYVRRPKLERVVRAEIENDRHPIVTLIGRGGIGKTSLALAVLHEIASTTRFSVIVWFSARDVDLTISGPKVVKPRVLTDREIAEQYRVLINGQNATKEERAQATAKMAADLRETPAGPTLFVFDNFETVRSPIDLFNWLDTHVRLPNKIVITSRFREFKADFPVEVGGMESDEADGLIASTSKRLNIKSLSTTEKNQIKEESDGHPYVVNIILGEIASTGSFSKPSKMLVRKDDILDALFERTYSNLTPLAVRIFLTLTGWRSLVPQIAVEAVLLRHGVEGTDPERAVDELVRMSLIQRTRAEDGNDFLGVPLAAALFGEKKFQVSRFRDVIENDIRFLQEIGATSKSGLKDGIRPRIVALFRRQARKIEDGSLSLEELRPVLEFVARGYPPAWILMADLEMEVRGAEGHELAAGYLRRFLEGKPTAEDARPVWQKLISMYRSHNDVRAACNALVRSAESAEPSLDQISSIANWLNTDRDVLTNTEVIDRETLFRPLAALMEKHLSAASPTDLSRLAWLHLHAGDEQRALAVAWIGLGREPSHPHCLRLVDRLKS